jgi:D-amino peptidase
VDRRFHDFAGAEDAVQEALLAATRAEKGVLTHTESWDGIQNVWINNRSTGEIGLLVMLAGYFNVPTIMLSGDAAACRELHELVPESECAEVKAGVSRTAAFMLSHPAAARGGPGQPRGRRPNVS